MSATAGQSVESPPKRPIFSREVRIEWGDCDPAGIVFYPRYLAFFDASTAYLLESVGLPQEQLAARYGIVGMPLIEVQAKFHLPSRFGERVTLECNVAECSRSRLTVEHRVLRSGELAVQARECRVWVQKDPLREDAIRICAIAQEVVDRLVVGDSP